MKSNLSSLYIALFWLFTLGIAYALGWWVGVRSVTHLAAESLPQSFNVLATVIGLAVIGTVFATLRLKGHWDRRNSMT